MKATGNRLSFTRRFVNLSLTAVFESCTGALLPPIPHIVTGHELPRCRGVAHGVLGGGTPLQLAQRG